MFFSRYASQVTMLVQRGLEGSMSAYLIDQINAAQHRCDGAYAGYRGPRQ